MPVRDRVSDWQEELLRIEPELAGLPAAARLAVLVVVVDFLEEDVAAAA
jgi:hypothetical protein